LLALAGLPIAPLTGWKFTFVVLFNAVIVISFCVLLLLSEHDDVHGSDVTVLLS
jgi:hypothetical protein